MHEAGARRRLLELEAEGRRRRRELSMSLRPGGVARVTKVHRSPALAYDVKYVLGGSEKKVARRGGAQRHRPVRRRAR